MSTHDGHIPVLDVDQVFPTLTTDTASRGGSPATGEDQSATVAAALRSVLGWRPRAQDTQAFAAALRASFQLTETEGHTVSSYVPRGVAMQADLGGISGGQASLYSRARLAAQQATTLLDGLTPLRVDFDPQDGEAFRTLVRHGVTRLVEELGNPGGPRQAIVEGAFDVLLGHVPTGGLAGNGALSVLSAYTADTVPGQLGALRDRFGLVDEYVNTVEEEALRTSFWTLVDLVLDLRRAWEAQKGGLGSGSGSGFLGTDLVVVNRLLAAAAEQVDELEAVLDSALVGPAERQTVVLGRDSGLTLDGLLTWTRRFLTEDGPLYLRDTGRDGIRTAFAPLAQQLVTTVRRQLVDRLGPPRRGVVQQPTNRKPTDPDPLDPVVYIPVSNQPRFPSGMYAARTRVAVSGLSRLLENLFATSSRISRYPGVVLFDVQFTVLEDPQPPTDGQEIRYVGDSVVRAVRVDVRGANLRPTYLPALRVGVAQQDDRRPGRTRLLLPIGGSESADDDTLVGVFAFGPLELLMGELGVALGRGPRSVLLPAQSVPVEIIDGETGQVVHAPPVLDWPANRRSPRAADTGHIPWDDYLDGSSGAPGHPRGPGGPHDPGGGGGAVPGQPGRARQRPEVVDALDDLLDDELDDGPDERDEQRARVPSARVGNGGSGGGAAPEGMSGTDAGDAHDAGGGEAAGGRGRARGGRRTATDGGRDPRAAGGARDRAGITAVLERDADRADADRADADRADADSRDTRADGTGTTPRKRAPRRAAEPTRERAPRKQAARTRTTRARGGAAAQQDAPAGDGPAGGEGPPEDRREQPGGADTDGS